MLVKSGVDISRLNRGIRRALRSISDIFDREGQEVVITSTYEGNHRADSLHYANDAVDIRLPSLKISNLALSLRTHLGSNYDIVFEHDHIHIEYDPK